MKSSTSSPKQPTVSDCVMLHHMHKSFVETEKERVILLGQSMDDARKAVLPEEDVMVLGLEGWTLLSRQRCGEWTFRC